MSIKITIPIAPVTKKNHGQIVSVGGKPKLIPSKQFRAYQDSVWAFFKPLGIGLPCKCEMLVLHAHAACSRPCGIATSG